MLFVQEAEWKRAEEDRIFQEYALQKIQDAQDAGCSNVAPLIKAANLHLITVKPQGSYPQDSTVWKKSPGNPAPGNTQKRLGFTWDS